MTSHHYKPGNQNRHGDRLHQAVYVISVAAELAGVHPQTLRGYERRGLLEPARTSGGSRRYSDADLAQLQRIHELTDEGLNLAGVTRILQLEQQVVELQELLATQQQAQHSDPQQNEQQGQFGS